MRILALDMATQTGYAANTAPWISGSVCFPVKRGESPGMRFLRFRKWLYETYEVMEAHIDVICYEQAHHRGGAATAVGVGMTAIVQEFSAEHDIELMAVHTGTLKKFATGLGNASKGEMMAAAMVRGWEPIDDNEADALWLLAYAIDNLQVH